MPVVTVGLLEERVLRFGLVPSTGIRALLGQRSARDGVRRKVRAPLPVVDVRKATLDEEYASVSVRVGVGSNGIQP